MPAEHLEPLSIKLAEETQKKEHQTFHFKRRHLSLNWKLLSAVDIDKIMKKVSFNYILLDIYCLRVILQFFKRSWRTLLSAILIVKVYL
jgi:hypothetical protein